jgi:hydrogenase/urease accessory protein HupE
VAVAVAMTVENRAPPLRTTVLAPCHSSAAPFAYRPVKASPLSGFRSQVSGFCLPCLPVLCLLLFVVAPVTARAHGLVFTRVEALVASPREIAITIDYNLALVLPQPAAYYPLTQSSVETQKAAITRALPQILAAMEFYAGDDRLVLELQSFALPKLSAAAFDDPAQDKSAELRFTAKLPAKPGSLVLVVPYDAPVEHPVLFAAGTQVHGVLARSWVEEGPSEPFDFDWTKLPVPGEAVAVAARTNPGLVAGGERPPTPWYVDFWTYLRLGFKHIIPEGLDHILFVLALFFLGQTWRKLVAQTTVFTIAHATTLFLSRYGVVNVPGRIVEPLIAFSIACIALENIWWPKLGPARLALVFAFGLIHGLGFASSLSEVKFPEHQFLVALLGFNFGVDFGQLFIIALALLAVGWWREKPWFRTRIMIPCCTAIAAIGVYWTVRRIGF